MPEQDRPRVEEFPPNNADLIQRLRDLLGMDVLGNFQLTENMSFTYSWHHGYEKLSVSEEHDGKKLRGGHEYSGSHHPDALCRGNPCRYCGKAWIED